MTAKAIPGALLALVLATAAWADDARVVGAKAVRHGNSYTISVTLRHGDTGWDDYADAWRVELEDGTVLGTRILVHPHETRTTRTPWSGIRVPLDL